MMSMNRILALLLLAHVSCSSDTLRPESDFANKCAHPRTGVDPQTNKAYPDVQGTLDDEKSFLYSWIGDLYLWYREVPNSPPQFYATAIDYFNVLKTPATTPSGKPKDQFHFTF